MQSRDFFLSWKDGSIGKIILKDFMKQLKSDELAKYCQASSDPAMMQTCFQLITFGMSDIWRICCLPALSLPHRMFALATCSHQEVKESWTEFQRILSQCPECVDAGFSSPLLKSVKLDDLTTCVIDEFLSCSYQVNECIMFLGLR